jgi:hypothetical protein
MRAFALGLVLCIFLSLVHGARLRRAGESSAGMRSARKSRPASALSLRTAQASPAPDVEEEPVRQPLLDSALSKIDDWVEGTREADETGTLGMPPKGSSIVIDGPSVAWAHGEHKKFSTDGLNRVVDFFLEKGYTSVVALVSLTYSQEPPKGSPRTRVADDIDALKRLQAEGHVHFIPPGASDDAMLLQYAWSQQAYLVSNNDFADFKLECSEEEEEWVRTHHIYFTWHDGLFLPTCDHDYRAPRQTFTSRREREAGAWQDGTGLHDAAEQARKEDEDEIFRRVAEAMPRCAWIPAGGVGIARPLPTISFLALLQSKGWDKVDEDTLESLVQVCELPLPSCASSCLRVFIISC